MKSTIALLGFQEADRLTHIIGPHTIGCADEVDRREPAWLVLETGAAPATRSEAA